MAIIGIIGGTVVLLLIFRSAIFGAINTLTFRLAQCPAKNETATIFYEHLEFQTWENSADEHWNALIPANGGFASRKDYNDGNPYGYSMIHQLHCVQMIRNDLRELLARIDGRSDGKDNYLYWFDEPHTLHCLDYLRQGRRYGSLCWI